MDEKKEIRRAVDTGKVYLGEKEAEKNILKGIGELILLSKNIDNEKREKIQHLAGLAKMPFYEFNGTSVELGSICGKPFPVSMLLVKSAGKSSVLELAK